MILFLFVCIVACEKKEESKPALPLCGTSDGRTVIVYMAAENSLSAYVNSDVSEMLEGVKYMGAKDHLILYVDNTSSARIYDITWQDTARYMRDLKPAFQWKEDVNSCDAENLRFVLNYAREHSQVNSYYLVMWSHGSGWLPDFNDRYKNAPKFAFGIDNMNGTTSDSGPQMDISDLADVCEEFGQLDVILFDACFMQNIETAYELRHSARYIVGSPAEIPAEGAPYNLLMQPLFTDGDNVKEQIDSYHIGYNKNAVLLSAVKTDALENFARFTASYVSRYREAFLSLNSKDLLNYFDYDKNNRNGMYCDFFDIRGLMQRVLSDDDYQLWNSEYEKIISYSVVSNYWTSVFAGMSGCITVDKSQYGGMTMHVPLSKYDTYSPWFSKYFFSLDWANDVWEESQNPE